VILAFVTVVLITIIGEPHDSFFHFFKGGAFKPIQTGLLIDLGLAVVVTLINTVDAIIRRVRNPSVGMLPVFVAAAGPMTCGVSAFAYYLRWGWQRLPKPRHGRHSSTPDLKGASNTARALAEDGERAPDLLKKQI
jgi:hypothetical protein